MAVTILSRHPESYTKYVLPQSRGIEERDVRAFPLPPRTNFALLNAVIDELRDQGHAVATTFKRERLADWTRTNRANDRSFCADEGWQPNAKGPVLIHFVEGGWWGSCKVDERETILTAEMLRMGRQQLRIIIAGRP